MVRNEKRCRQEICLHVQQDIDRSENYSIVQGGSTMSPRAAGGGAEEKQHLKRTAEGRP